MNVQKDDLIFKINKATYIDIEQFEYAYICPKLLETFLNPYYREKRLLSQSFTQLHKRIFSSVLKTTMQYFYKYNQPLPSERIIKNYLIKYSKFRNNKALLSKYKNDTEQMFDGQSIAYKTIRHIANDARNFKIMNCGKKNSIELDISDIVKSKDKVILFSKFPYYFQNRFPYNIYNFYIPYVQWYPIDNFETLYSDQIQQIKLYMVYKQTFSSIRRGNCSKRYYIQYIKPDTNDINYSEFNHFKITQSQEQNIFQLYQIIKNKQYFSRQSTQCQHCYLLAHCLYNLTPQNNDTINIINTIKDGKIKKQEVNNLIYKLVNTKTEQETESLFMQSDKTKYTLGSVFRG